MTSFLAPVKVFGVGSCERELRICYRLFQTRQWNQFKKCCHIPKMLEKPCYCMARKDPVLSGYAEKIIDQCPDTPEPIC